MTNAEKITLKLQALDSAVALLRRVVRHNGAAISAKADLTEIADHVLDFSLDRVKTMWDDINTIDRVKHIMREFAWQNRPDLTTEELLELEVNDATMTAAGKSWAVVRITRRGTELLSYGGSFYQAYDEGTTTQSGDTELLKSMLSSDEAVWLSDAWSHTFTGREQTYIEGGVEYVQIPCELPGDINKLQAISIKRVDADGVPASSLSYSLTDNSCSAHDGIIGLPHGMWLIYDNAELESAPQALLIPKELVSGNASGFRFTYVEVFYSNLVSGLERLRLMGESFGEEYIISTRDFEEEMKGTWLE